MSQRKISKPFSLLFRRVWQALAIWVLQSWWVGLACLAVGLVYLQASKNREALLQEMAMRRQEMECEKRRVLEEKEQLQLILASQDDPAWIEMVLMRELGVVPKGWMKVHFQK